MEKGKMEKYELLYILAAKYTDAEVKSLMDKIKGVIVSAGGAVSDMHDLGRRKLAYAIKHVRNGSYVLVNFEASPEIVNKLNETFRLSADILRHLIVTKDPYLTKVPDLTEKEERREEDEDRGPRPAPVRIQAHVRPVEAKEVSMEEIDKKLDKILTDDVA